MSVKFEMDRNSVPNGAVLLLGINYPPRDGDPVDSPRKTFTYVALKAGGLWYFTGTGRVPVAAGWGAVERWMESDGRELVSVKMMSAVVTLWPESVGVAEPRDEDGPLGQVEAY